MYFDRNVHECTSISCCRLGISINGLLLGLCLCIRESFAWGIKLFILQILPPHSIMYFSFKHPPDGQASPLPLASPCFPPNLFILSSAALAITSLLLKPFSSPLSPVPST